jgi:uncharacterized Zn-finger protein
MLEPIYQLINLLEEGNDKKLTKFLKRHTIEDLLKEKDVDSDDEYCLALQAIKYKSSIFLKYLLESNYPVNEIDYFSRSTYNYLELYGTEEINELLKDYQVTPDNHLEEAYKALEQAKKNLKLPTSVKDLQEAHKYTHDNGYLLFAKQDCVCIYCGERFNSSDIVEHYLSDTGQAACPYCGIDAVIGEVSGFKLTDKFIEAMYEYFFNNPDIYSRHITESPREDI